MDRQHYHTGKYLQTEKITLQNFHFFACKLFYNKIELPGFTNCSKMSELIL